MALDLTTAAGALKKFYLPALREQINNKTVLLTQVERSSEHVEGEEWVMSLHVKRNPGVGARAEGGTLPTAGNQSYKHTRGPVRENNGRFQVTGKAIKALASDRGSFIRAVDSEMKGLKKDVPRDVNRQIYGTSNGVIATCGVTSASTTVVLATSTPLSAMRQLEVGMFIDIGTVATPTSVASAREITANDPVAKTIVISGAAVTTAGTDFVFRSGNGGSGANQKEVTGLKTIVSDSGSLFDVDPVTYPVWKATRYHNSGTLRPISEQLLEQVMDDVSIASGEEIDLWMFSYGVYRAYGNLLTTLKRFPNTIDLKGGHKGLEITSGGQSAAAMRDRDCQDNTGYALNTKHLFSPEMSDWEFMDEDGAVLSRVSNQHAYEGTLFKFHELVPDQRNAHGILEDVRES